MARISPSWAGRYPGLIATASSNRRTASIVSAFSSACLRLVERLPENRIDLIEQGFDDLYGLAVLVRGRRVVARKIGLVAFRIDRLRACVTHAAPALDGPPSEDIHFRQQLAENLFGCAPVLNALIPAAQILDVLIELDAAIVFIRVAGLALAALRYPTTGSDGSRSTAFGNRNTTPSSIRTSTPRRCRACAD